MNASKINLSYHNDSTRIKFLCMKKKKHTQNFNYTGKVKSNTQKKKSELVFLNTKSLLSYKNNMNNRGKNAGCRCYNSSANIAFPKLLRYKVIPTLFPWQSSHHVLRNPCSYT